MNNYFRTSTISSISCEYWENPGAGMDKIAKKTVMVNSLKTAFNES